MAKLKAPFPYFGGKSRVANLVWDALGDCDNYIEPFCGSAAVLLARPHDPRIETVNDFDCYVANFWRATRHDPEAVAACADGPVNEADLHARHRWLVLSVDAAAFRKRMRTDPDYYDAKIAGWWCWGLCAWIGGGWCTAPAAEVEQVPVMSAAGRGMDAEAQEAPAEPSEKRPQLHTGNSDSGRGVHAQAKEVAAETGDAGGGLATSTKRPRAHSEKRGGGTLPGVHGAPAEPEPSGPATEARRPQAPAPGSTHGQGVHAKVPNCDSRGMDAAAGLSEQVPLIGACGGEGSGICYGLGVHAKGDGGRPQLADAYARGRGVHGNDAMGTCAQRRRWLVDWFGRLRDRLRTVRVCCGHWLRVCDSPSVTTRLGLTGIFLDPPYGAAAGRDANLYAQDSLTVAAEVNAYCLERGADPRVRIVLAGYAGEHDNLEAHGWTVTAWKAQGGYGNRSAKGKDNAKKERLWLSPHCLRGEEPGLFGMLADG